MKVLLVLVMVTLSFTADARGIYFGIKGDSQLAESTRITRCPPELEARETKNGAALATCRPVNKGHLLGVTEGRRVRLKLVAADGTVTWQRVIDGSVAFATGMMLVLDAPGGYRVLWLAESDGRTLREARFVKLTKAPTDDFRCGDLVDQWLRSTEKSPRLAQVCTVLD